MISRLPLILGLLLVGCGAPADAPADLDVTHSDSAGVPVVTISGAVESLPEWSVSSEPITDILGTAPPFLGSVGAVALVSDGTLLVYDRVSAELHRFDADGRVLGRVAAAGDGPGELRTLVRLSVTAGDTIHAFDRRLRRVSVFAPDGAFLRAIPIASDVAGPGTPVEDVVGLGADRMLLHGVVRADPDPPGGEVARIVRERIMQLVDESGAPLGEPIRTTGEFGVRSAFGEVGSPFSHQPFVAAEADRVVHGTGPGYELVLRDRGMRPIRVIRWTDWRRSLDVEAVDTLRGPMSASIAGLRAVNPGAAADMVDALLHPAAVPDSLPAIGAVLLDDRQRIWVSRFHPTSDLMVATVGEYEQWHQEQVWHVLDADGAPLARMRLPPSSRLLAVQSDRVVVVTRDAQGVEHVRVLGVVTGSELVETEVPDVMTAAPVVTPSATTLTAEGWDALRIGMTREEVVAAAGEDANPSAVGGPDPEQCDQFRPARAPEGLLVMLEQGRLTRISISAGAGIATDGGVAVGDSAAAVRRAHASRATATPHKYIEAPAEYLTVWTTAPPDTGARGIVYEIGLDGRVMHIHAGGPSIQYVEGCL